MLNTYAAFFNCVRPITREKSTQNGYHPKFECIGKRIIMRRYYMNKINKKNISFVYESSTI